MVQAIRRVTLALALTTLLAADGYGQGPPPASAPVSLAAPCATPPAESLSCPPPPTAGPVLEPAPPACAPFEAQNGPLLWGDPLLDWRSNTVPGLIAAVEVGAVLPSYQAGPFQFFPVHVGGAAANVSPPMTGLNWTAAPKFDLGCRLGQGFGDLLVSYRFIDSEATGIATGFGPPATAPGAPPGMAQVRSRMNFNIIDLLYASHESSLGPLWDMRWDAGVRLTNFYYDTRATSPALEQRASNDFRGGGPKAGLGLRRFIASVPGLSVGGRVDGAFLFGRYRQRFEEVDTPAGGPPVGGAAILPTGGTVTVGVLEANVGYAPGWMCGRTRIEAGYRYERWWSIGEAQTNRGVLELQTLFVRWTYNY